MMTMKKELKSKPVLKKERKKPRIDFEKIFYEAMSLAADITEKASISLVRPLQFRRISRVRLRDQILHAESWPERDRLLRGLAAKCYEIANAYAKEGGDMELSLKWMKLVARLLGLSFTPKRQEDLELIKKELAEVKAEMRELENGED